MVQYIAGLLAVINIYLMSITPTTRDSEFKSAEL
jgi:hypothetical protein